ncbi:MAG: 50S ribosomal protein L15 [Pirellulales bacterium]|nr:50S ribosomal protein L15 [Pirellulales bacterium]
MRLHDVHQGIHKHRKPRRVGRGPGSGRGKTAGRGHKGQGQLAGWTTHPAFEGGQMPLSRRVPKRGFHNRWAAVVQAVNVGALSALFQDGEEVTPQRLREVGLISGRCDAVKILGDGELQRRLIVSAHRFSRTAAEKIQARGGQVVVLPGPAPVANKRRRQKQAGNQAQPTS